MKTTIIPKNISTEINCILKEKNRSFELCAWLVLLFFCNHSLLQGRMSDHFVFWPSLVVNGEWYRAVLAPFVHVSWYHLTLDATAFLFLWKGLYKDKSGKRWIYLIFCWAGSLLAPLLMSERIYQIGLCGLSGISHGLFAVSSLELTVHKEHKRVNFVGLALLGGLLAKVIWEMLSGEALLKGMHLGPVGTPLASSHFGGLIGGCLAYVLIRMACVLNK